jgi:hypothetical protein
MPNRRSAPPNPVVEAHKADQEEPGEDGEYQERVADHEVVDTIVDAQEGVLEEGEECREQPFVDCAAIDHGYPPFDPFTARAAEAGQEAYPPIEEGLPSGFVSCGRR